MKLFSLILTTVLNYTLPQWSAIGCDSIVTNSPAEVSITEIWWSPRWNGVFSKLYEKSVLGMDGLPDTISVPSDTIGTASVRFRDVNGNISCFSNYVTVNAPPVGVEIIPYTNEKLYDIQGRVASKPYIPGIYFTKTKGIVIIRIRK